MDENYNCGSVAFLEKIKNPISVARKVMEKTPHIMLVGEGAQKFALENGFELDDYKNPEAIKAYKEWLKTAQYKPIINIENHDTIGMIAMAVSYTHLRAHETVLDLVCRLLLEKKKDIHKHNSISHNINKL